jgi:hypothetical protein
LVSQIIFLLQPNQPPRAAYASGLRPKLHGRATYGSTINRGPCAQSDQLPSLTNHGPATGLFATLL